MTFKVVQDHLRMIRTILGYSPPFQAIETIQDHFKSHLLSEDQTGNAIISPLVFPDLGSKNSFHKIFLILTKDFKNGFCNRKLNYPIFGSTNFCYKIYYWPFVKQSSRQIVSAWLQPQPNPACWSLCFVHPMLPIRIQINLLENLDPLGSEELK